MIGHIDHFVLTVRSVEASCAFDGRVLGFRRVDAPGRPSALAFGHQKINLHEVGRTFEPKAAAPTPGSGDFCLIAAVPIETVRDRLLAEGVPIELGPVEREGAQGPMTSLYFRDPDGNLVEVGSYRR
ncbi:VOC family protein [Prosthecomicrobium pneumaticum]|uniref:Catechol 2,3-dioxygenase-like lactoylglutathione lyase family enzyme n=1 Tax=Prosthecomicrobium pneumaticum TaxID=81895 RepID=A0A7W9FKN9_9HYPH|nr:VOC family protein [Prosthecomicrobium pneumaticum]MBB5751183.1 catechol 2,3-dioxygenase-like lactoylglutathione lyase family enzyme [Prosthecomicrobium pneumaticum]